MKRSDDGRVSPLVIVILVLVVVAGTGAAVALLAGGSNENLPTKTLRFPAAKTKGLTTPPPKPSVQVIVRADTGTCWTGFVESKAIFGCGDQEYKVLGGSSLVGANARKKSTGNDSLSLELVINGDTVDRAATTKALGLITVTGQP